MAFRCNNDLLGMAEDFLADAKQIADEEPMAAVRRASLYRAAGDTLLALAELTSMPLVTKCDACLGPGRHVNPCSKCGGLGYLVTP